MKEKTVFRGHVYMCSDLPKVGSIQGGTRPMVVITSNELANLHSPVVTCIPLTSKPKTKLPTHHTLDKGKYPFLEYDSTVLCEQIFSINKRDLRFIGIIEDYDMKKIDRCLKIQLDL